jgi:serine/threonine-protein kinase
MPDYDLEKRLGNGAFGEVWLGNDRALGVQRAIKFVPPHKIKDPTNFYEEPQTLMTLKHDNIVAITDAGKTADGQLYIAMEYYPNGSISDMTKGGIVPLRLAIKLIGDTCRGLEYAHAADFIHRDIKPANIILDSTDNARLSDFGLATKVSADGTASPYGYIGHLAPEVITNDITDKRTDIYAIGVTLYRMINGDAYLPMAIDPDELLERIKDGTFPNRNSYRPFIPASIRTIINHSLSINPGDRFQTASELRHALEKVKLFTHWLPKTIPNGNEWTCSVGNMEFLAKSLRQSYGCFDFELYKGQKGKPKRIVSADCGFCEKKSQHERRIRKVLTRIVTKGK